MRRPMCSREIMFESDKVYYGSIGGHAPRTSLCNKLLKGNRCALLWYWDSKKYENFDTTQVIIFPRSTTSSIFSRWSWITSSFSFCDHHQEDDVVDELVVDEDENWDSGSSLSFPPSRWWPMSSLTPLDVVDTRLATSSSFKGILKLGILLQLLQG